MRMFLAALFTMTSFAAAQAGFYTGNEIASQCRINRQFVSGYVSGTVDKATIDAPALYEFYVDSFDPKNSDEKTQKINKSLGEASVLIEGYCIPKGATVGQTGDVFCKYLEENQPKDKRTRQSCLDRR
jgi:hypothetical protein